MKTSSSAKRARCEGARNDRISRTSSRSKQTPECGAREGKRRTKNVVFPYDFGFDDLGSQYRPRRTITRIRTHGNSAYGAGVRGNIVIFYFHRVAECPPDSVPHTHAREPPTRVCPAPFITTGCGARPTNRDDTSAAVRCRLIYFPAPPPPQMSRRERHGEPIRTAVRCKFVFFRPDPGSDERYLL